jgi:geranylgeranyl diphosphate/geranylgeranyl-bacteriochlorophyllide a reductase
MFDVAIIGAGPAGATLARLIGQRYKVLLVDRRPLNEPETLSLGKCCGGLLAPDAQAMLSRLGLGLPKSVLEEPQLFVVRAIDVPRRLERCYQRHYINMDRLRFDRWLLSMVPDTADVRLGLRLQTFEPQDDGFRLVLRQGDKEQVETARMVVGADGAGSRVRALLELEGPAPKKYFAIQEWVEADDRLPCFSSVFDPEITDYYSWTIPKGKYLIVGAALPPKNRTTERFELLKSKLRDWGFEFGKTVWQEGTFILRPQSVRQVSTGSKGVALIGEAAGWISPSSAEGLSYAFRSAQILAEVLHTGIEGFESRYHRASLPLRRNIFLKSLKSRVVFNPILRGIVLRLGLQSMTICGLNAHTTANTDEPNAGAKVIPSASTFRHREDSTP